MAAPGLSARLPEPPAPGTLARLLVGGRVVCVANVAGTLFAFDDACPHRQGSLAAGRLDGCALTCLQHGWRFDVASGACLSGGRGRLCRHEVTANSAGVIVTLRREPWPDRLRRAVRRWPAASRRSGLRHTRR